MADTIETQLIVEAISRGFDSLGKDFQNTAKAAGETEKQTGLLDKVMSKFVFTAGDVVGGLKSVGSTLWSTVEAAGEAEKVTASLDATIQATGRTGETSSAELYEYADSLKQTAIYGDDAIASGLGVLVGFKQISEEVRNNAAPVMLDMAGKFGGVQGAADKLGAALNDFDGFTKVSRQIGGFTAEQEAMFAGFKEANDLIGYQDYLLNLLSQRFGGQAAAAAGTFAGKMEIIRDRFGEVQEVAGNALLPALSELADEVIPALEDAAEELQPIIQEMVASDLPGMVAQAKEIIAVLPDVVSHLDEVRDVMVNLQKISPTYWFSQAAGAIGDLGSEINEQAEHTGEVTHQVGVYTNSVIRLDNTIRGHTKTVTAEGNAYDYLIPRVEETEVATVALSGAYDYMIGVAERTENQMETYRGTLGGVAEEERGLATATDSINASMQRLHDSTQAADEAFAGYFSNARTSTEQTTNWNMVLLEAAERSGANAYQLGILAAATGEYTDAEIENILQTAAMTAKAEELGQALANGEISTRDAITALQDFKAELDNTAGDYNVNVHTSYTSSGQPPPVGSWTDQGQGGMGGVTESGHIYGAAGGLVTGGIPGRDSVPLMAMPGERLLSVEDNRNFERLMRALSGHGRSTSYNLYNYGGSRGNVIQDFQILQAMNGGI